MGMPLGALAADYEPARCAFERQSPHFRACPALKCGTVRTAYFRPLASALHHAASAIHPILMLIRWRAAIVDPHQCGVRLIFMSLRHNESLRN
jgi:hypothetical protein